MPLFRKQPLCCQICGKPGEGQPDLKRAWTCSEEHRKELEWRQTLYILGKDYYPHPEAASGAR